MVIEHELLRCKQKDTAQPVNIRLTSQSIVKRTIIALYCYRFLSLRRAQALINLLDLNEA